MEIRSTLQIFSGENPVLLEKRILLLEAIARTGSITHAAKEVPLSYKAAWDAIDLMNNLSPHPLVESSKGRKGGGTHLTEYGEKIVHLYRRVSELQNEFIDRLGRSVDLEKNELKTLQRMTMQISARNQLHGAIVRITQGAVNSEVDIQLKGGEVISATVTKESVQELDLKEGVEAVAIFKASSVILVSGECTLKTSARNQLKGKVVKVEMGAVNAEVVLEFGGGDRLAAIITKEAVRELSPEMDSEMGALIKASNIIIGV